MALSVQSGNWRSQAGHSSGIMTRNGTGDFSIISTVILNSGVIARNTRRSEKTQMRRIESKKGLPAHCENVRIDWARAVVTCILLAAILCLIPACAAAQKDTGPGRDIAAIHHLIEQYAKAVDTVDLNLLSQIWSHSPEVSFIYPLGEEHGFDAIEQQVFQNIMGGMFSARDLEMHGVAIHVSGNTAWSEFHWIFHATMRQEGSAVTTHGVETQVYRRESGKWRLVHVHYSEDRQSVP